MNGKHATITRIIRASMLVKNKESPIERMALKFRSKRALLIPAGPTVRTWSKEKMGMKVEKKPPSVLKQVAELNDMDLGQLRECWRELFDVEPAKP